MDKIGAISFLHYFESCAECKAKSSVLEDSLFELSCNPKNQEKGTTLFYLLAGIIKIGFDVPHISDQNSHKNENAAKFAVSLLNKLTTKVWDYLWESLDNDTTVFELPMDSPQASMYFHLPNIQICYLEQLACLISYKPEMRASTAIKTQHDWTFFKSPKNVVNLITQVCCIF